MHEFMVQVVGPVEMVGVARTVGASAWAGKVRANEIGRRGAGKVVWLLPRPYRSSKRITAASTAAGTAPHQWSK